MFYLKTLRSLEEYKKATELKDKQLAEAKKVLQGAKIATIHW